MKSGRGPGPRPTPTGLPLYPFANGTAPAGLAIGGTGELTQLIAVGRLMALLPASITDRVPSGVTCLPVTDAPATTLVVAWPRDSRSLPVAEFVQIAAEVAAGYLPVTEPGLATGAMSRYRA